MSRTLAVALEGVTVGTLEMRGTGALVLTYDDTYTADPDATPLSVSMPTVQPQWSGSAVRNWLANLLPDNDRVLERWATQFQVSPNSPFRLLQHVGRDVAGAVQFLPPQDLDDLDSGGVDWLDDDQLTRRLAEVRADPAAWTPQLAAGLFSLSGAQAKIALRYDERRDRWGLPYGTEPTTHILKPYAGDLPHQALNEHLSLALAVEVGLPAARSRILTIGGHPVVSVERYDRLVTDGAVRRVHQEDMCQALGLPPTRKYETDGGPGIVTVVELLRRVMGPADSPTEVDRFLRAQAFACGTAATDAHAKNYSLLLSGPQVLLAPLYDLHSAAPYFTAARRSVPPGQISVHQAGLAMRVGAARRFDEVDKTAWQTLAAAVRVPDEHLLALAAEVFETIPDAVDRVARGSQDDRAYTSEEKSFVDAYVTAVTKRAKNALSGLRGRGPRTHRSSSAHGTART